MFDLPIITHNYIIKGSGELHNIDVSVAEYVIDCMKKNPECLLVEAETGRTIKNNQLLKNIVALAQALKARGIGPNDVVGICSENRLEFAEPLVATLSIGATLATLNPLYTIDELNHVLSISRPKIVFCSPFTANKLKEVQNRLSFIKEIVLFDFGISSDDFTNYSKLMNERVDINSFQCLKLNPRDSVAVILCSSGTTGLPKGVELTHSNLMCFLSLSGEFHNSSNTEEEKRGILGLIPFFHGYGLLVILTSITINLTLVIMSRFDEEIFLSSIEKYKISMLNLVPPLMVFLAKHPLVEKYDLSSVKNINCGAAPLSRDIQVSVKERLKLPNDIVQGYGMTELSVTCTLNPSNKAKIGSVGVVVPGMEMKIIDPETGKALPPFRDGEICFRGPFVMKGYKNNSKATADTIDSDGWLHSGDIGYYDQDGYVFIVDRMKELIKFKGFQVAPAEIEALLLTRPEVKDAAVIGIPDKESGELPVAFIVKQQGAKITELELKKFVAGKLSPQKKLHKITFVDEIPKNPSGKILRRELRSSIKKSKL